ncbi:MAG: Zn-ribbon domain-containing OB-fold protein [Pseudomonadales bacterium]
MSYTTPIPRQGTHTRPFWQGAREGKLMLPKCEDCGQVHWYPRHICPHCHSMNLTWVEGSGEGTIYTYAVQHMVFGKWAEQAPFVTAYIDLKEGDRMLTVLRGVDPHKPEEIKIGAAVRVEFEQADDETFVPYWRVVEA